MELLYRPLCTVSLVIFLLHYIRADSDESQIVQLPEVPVCNRIEIPGYPAFYIETDYGFYWDTMQCPVAMVFDSLYCECILALNEPHIVTLAPPSPAPTTTTTYSPAPTTTTTSTPAPTTTTTTTPAPTTTTTTTPAPTTTTTIVTTPRSVQETKSDVPTKPSFTTKAVTTSSKPPTTEKPRRQRILKILFQLDKVDIPKATQPTTTLVMMTEKPVIQKQNIVRFESGILSKKSICSGCRFDGGIGYKNHERDCDKYVMCSPSGHHGNMKADVRVCGVGEYWDQMLLTCRLSKDVPCQTDKCKSMRNWFTYGYIGDCRAYWKCENGVSIGHCCPKGQGYANGIGCLRNPSCDSNCGLPHTEKGCEKRPVPGNPRKFRQTIAGHGDIDMDCAFGTVFNPDTCDCQTDTMISRTITVCKKELDLSFSPEVKDVSGKNVHVNGVNVTYYNSAVCFQGDGAVVVPRFANAEIGNSLDIGVRFKASKELIGNELQAVVYNGDCGMDPSIVVALAKDRVVYTLRNKSNRTRTLAINLPVKVDKWMTGKFSLQNDVMSMTVDGRSERKLFFGGVDRSRCGLKLGWGKQYDSFVGCVDKMSVSFCPTSKS